MTVVSITKKKIINAIRKEPASKMKPMEWLHYRQAGLLDWEQIKKAKDCPVCAVGAIFRNILNPNQSLTWFSHAVYRNINRVSDDYTLEYCSLTRKEIFQKAKDLVERQKYMSSISYLFENLCYQYERKTNKVPNGSQIENIKRSIISFVQKNFPNKIEINIDRAKPAKDVKIISK